jgi:hypothetical protein
VKRLGKPPYIQQLSETAIKLSESGSLQSRSAYPQEPAPFDNNVIVIGNNVTRSPNFDRVGNAIYQTNFKYTYYYLSRGVPDFAGRARELFNAYGKIRRRQPQQGYREEIGRRQIGF